ncbi:sigma factor-like helix-turn-helix DNA-binding protein [Verrucosispora sioxanthis]|uniref:RNA polymerase subunit sigma n=1 Tax=Verrucosispora sioxanthis TaxID=2499994 RepID=A0A6M1L4W6_9ACTN|nr:sigma factor-like helix-turn-helix DNA-binding protein [Verrucosispora sioxanthis]NEE64450.1 RNA polymerase subunit sigma [Verrucosispora sioxanthis]NGM13560.1 RNA polymerase subunit sigma [Verrucosispora sioxanthis]
MPDDAEITAWAIAAGHGDQQAAAAFIRATQHQVQRMFLHLAGPADGLGLTRETYTRAMRELPSIVARSSAWVWLLGIARQVAVEHAQPEKLDGERHARPGRGQGVSLNATDQLVNDLTWEQREAFVVTQMLGLSYAGAAAVCGCSVGDIRARVAQARVSLVAAVGERPAPRSLGRNDAAG